ncbi:hypothetical protein H6G76_15690 [Nostoc sp. FACHB-152]|uniref:hypothetical protein n=1 Tax=unclassified Nostoc TaxID=2593658 RepID=UPI001685CB33|nr:MULTISPECIES: hypothetical protein [unclassified Nostoc]MBD2448569.1 hypothetical protein [Nostoc sp. FACHB-152]MBD2469963.1 hypothetical protein [Nostoc sp. FACHB-145]
MATKELSSNRLKAHIETLGNAGDLTAPAGSRPWAIAVRLEMQAVLHDAAFNAQQLKAWRDLIKQYDGYQQLVDEHGKPFNSYEELCKAQPPFGFGCEPSDIDKIIRELELANEKTFDIKTLPLQYGGNPKGYLQRFSQVVQAYPDNQPINVEKIREVLHLASSKAHIWRKRWHELGWIELISGKKRGYYQITEEGRKVVKEWLEKVPSPIIKGGLWLNIPRHNPKKAAEQLIKALDSEQLEELYSLIGQSLNRDCL